MSKETRLNIRITPEFQKELQMIARFHGLTLTSYVHSTLVQRLRQEKAKHPEAFSSEQRSDAATFAFGRKLAHDLTTLQRLHILPTLMILDFSHKTLTKRGRAIPAGEEGPGRTRD